MLLSLLAIKDHLLCLMFNLNPLTSCFINCVAFVFNIQHMFSLFEISNYILLWVAKQITLYWTQQSQESWIFHNLYFNLNIKKTSTRIHRGWRQWTTMLLTRWDPVWWHVLTLIPPWIRNYIEHKVGGEIIFPLPTFDIAVEFENYR